MPTIGTLSRLYGVAPERKLECYKVLRGADQSVDVRYVIAALEHIAELNTFGRGDLKSTGSICASAIPLIPDGLRAAKARCARWLSDRFAMLFSYSGGRC